MIFKARLKIKEMKTPLVNTFLFLSFQVDLEVTLPGEGRDRVFRVAIKWVAQVSLYALEEALEGEIFLKFIFRKCQKKSFKVLLCSFFLLNHSG